MTVSVWCCAHVLSASTRYCHTTPMFSCSPVPLFLAFTLLALGAQRCGTVKLVRPASSARICLLYVFDPPVPKRCWPRPHGKLNRTTVCVWSGASADVMHDTLQRSLRKTFIPCLEPYYNRLLGLIWPRFNYIVQLNVNRSAHVSVKVCLALRLRIPHNYYGSNTT